MSFLKNPLQKNKNTTEAFSYKSLADKISGTSKNQGTIESTSGNSAPHKIKRVKTKMALAIAAFVIGLLLIAAAVLYNQGLLQQGINALGGNLSTVANAKAFAVALAAGALTTTIGLLSIIYLSKKIHTNRTFNNFTTNAPVDLYEPESEEEEIVIPTGNAVENSTKEEDDSDTLTFDSDSSD